jgi:hypothetical protein
MKRNLFLYAVAGVLACSPGVAAQNPPPSPSPPTQPPAAQMPATTVTVEGCLVREQDVPGRAPNVAERAGIREDFILTNAKVVKGPAAPDVAKTAQTPATRPDATRAGQTAGTAGNLQPMYDVKELDSDRLKALVGKRVQVEGTWADVERNQSAPPTNDLADIKGVSIREVAGQCPAKP